MKEEVDFYFIVTVTWYEPCFSYICMCVYALLGSKVTVMSDSIKQVSIPLICIDYCHIV